MEKEKFQNEIHNAWKEIDNSVKRLTNKQINQFMTKENQASTSQIPPPQNYQPESSFLHPSTLT
jgi:hypothetical protein